MEADPGSSALPRRWLRRFTSTRSQCHLLRPIGGIVRFSFGVSSAGYVRSRYGVLVARVEPGARLFLSAGEHVLTLRDPSPTTHVSIVFTPD